MRGYKPGRLSPDLRQALGIPENSPPPWLINMQRYGPPPAYPNLKIPGVNAPIPETITYGFGRLFTDEKGYTVYADAHGLNRAIYQRRQNRKPYWGSIKDIAEEDEEESISDAEEEEEEPEYEGIGREAFGFGEDDDLIEEGHEDHARANLEDLKAGIETMLATQAPDVDIKKSTASKVPLPSEPRPLYEILQEVKVRSYKHLTV